MVYTNVVLCCSRTAFLVGQVSSASEMKQSKARLQVVHQDKLSILTTSHSAIPMSLTQCPVEKPLMGGQLH